jgi:phage-related baseplate assembly protein
VAYAIQSSHPGVSFQIVENKNASGSGQAGSFLAYINNAGSTDPNSALIQSVKTAVDAVRPVSVTFGVLPATILPVSVALSITVQPGYDKINVVIPAVISAVQSYINGLGVGNAVRYSVLGSVAQLVEGVQYIELLSVNDGTIDVGGDPTTIVQSFAVTVS